CARRAFRGAGPCGDAGFLTYVRRRSHGVNRRWRSGQVNIDLRRGIAVAVAVLALAAGAIYWLTRGEPPVLVPADVSETTTADAPPPVEARVDLARAEP